MKSDQAAKAVPLISLPELVHLGGYFLLVCLLPLGWLDTLPGKLAQAIATALNPYLWERSLSKAADPLFFTHCHVLAVWVIAPFAWLLIIRRNHGWKATYDKFLDHYAGIGFFVMVAIYVLGMWFANDISYPLSRKERLIWSGSPVYWAVVNAYFQTLILYTAVPFIYDAFLRPKGESLP